MKRPTQRGITLPEVLIAIAILAAMTATIAPSVRTAFRVTFNIEQQATEQESLRIGRDVITRLLAGAVQSDERMPELEVAGTAKSLKLAAYDQNGSLMVLQLSGGTGLKTEIRDYLSDMQLYEGLFLASVTELSFSYFGAKSQRQEAAWHPSWQNARPPALIRISGTWESRTGVVPFVLDIPVGGQAPLICEFDPVSRLCRNTS